MESMAFYRKLCLKQQTELRKIMLSPNQFDRAIQLCLNQHAMLHAKKMAQTEPWSFEDEVFAICLRSKSDEYLGNRPIRSPGSSGISLDVKTLP